MFGKSRTREPVLNVFQRTVGGRNVVEKFIKSDLKKLPALQAQLVDQLRVLSGTPISTLRETTRIEHVESDLFSFRFTSKDHWVRLLITFWPTDDDIVVLLPVLKKRKKFDRSDIDRAFLNARILKSRV